MFRTSIGATQASQWGAENNDLDFSNISFDDEEEDDATQVKSQPKPSIGKTLQDLAATPSSTKKIIHQPSHSEVNQSNDINNTNNKPSSSTPNQINTSSGDSPVLSLKASTTLPSTTSTNHKSPSSSSSSPVHPLLRTNELEVMDTDDEEENTLHAIKSTLVTPKARVVSPTSVVATNNSHSNHISPPILMKSTSSTINSTTTTTTTSKSALPTSTASTNNLPTSTTSTTAATSHEPTTMNKQATKLASQTTNIIHTIHHATLMKPTSGQNSTDKSKTLPVMDEISSDDHSENENEESSLSAKKKTSSTTTSRSSSSSSSSKNQRINQSTTTTTTTTTMSSSSSTSNSQNQIKQVHDQQVRSEKLFKDLRFTVTSISTPTERERVIKAIRSHGGEVIETLEDIQEAEKIILIADDCTTKPNYLIALMMEIPLLKKEWIHDSISEGRLLVDSMYKYVLNRGSFLVRSTKQKKLVKQHVSSKLSCCVPMEERIFNSVKVRIIGSKDFKEKWTPILKAGGAKVMTVLKSQTDHLSNFLLVEDYDKLDAKVKKEAKQLKLPILDRDSLLEIIVTLERKLSSDQILNYSDLKSTVQKMAKKQTSKKRTLNDEDSESDSDEEEVEHKKDSTVESSQEIEELVQRKKSKPSPSETKETTKSQETKQSSQTSKSSISQIGSNIESVVAEHVPKQKDATIKPKDTTSLESNSLANGFYFRKSEYESNSFSQLLQIHDQSMEVICVGDVVQTLDDKYYRVDSFGFSRLVATEYVLAQQTEDTFRLLHESDRKHVEIPLCAIRHKVFVSNSSGMGERIFLIERPERPSILDDTSLISVEHRAVNILKYNVNHEFLPAASQKIQILQFNNCLFQENDVVKIVCSLEEGSRMACVGRIRFVLEDRLFIEVFRRHPNSEISDHYVTSFTVIPFSIKSISIMEPLHSFNDISVFNSYKKHLTTHGVQSIFVQEE